MRFSRAREEETRLGITPLIDIVFLLVIFLVLTSRFNQTAGLTVSLPRMNEAPALQAYKQERITIDKTGVVYHNGRAVSTKSLPNLFREMSLSSPPAALVLEADGETPHGSVVELMDLARASGIRSIIMATLLKKKGQR